jgi:hypothetical protein
MPRFNIKKRGFLASSEGLLNLRTGNCTGGSNPLPSVFSTEFAGHPTRGGRRPAKPNWKT